MQPAVRRLPLVLALAAILAPGAVLADINVGVTLSATGPAATLGIPEKNTIALLPTNIAGQKVNYIVLDDATDTTTAVQNARKLTAEHKVDVIVGSSNVPGTLAVVDVAVETGTPQIAMGPVEPPAEKMRWVFRTVPSNAFMAEATVEHMLKAGVKSVAYIGFADAFGESVAKDFAKVAEPKGLKVLASERYNRTDTSVTAQALKIIAANPDAVMIGASGVPGSLPHSTLIERGYKGKIYHTQAVVNRDFVRVGGKAVEGGIASVGPIVAAVELPDSHPSKIPALNYIRKYEAAHGANTANTFGALAWDAGLMLQRAIPAALKKAQPGTVEFRAALRDSLEAIRDLAGAQGVYNLSAKDHQGFDASARMLVRLQNGEWKLVK